MPNCLNISFLMSRCTKCVSIVDAFSRRIASNSSASYSNVTRFVWNFPARPRYVLLCLTRLDCVLFENLKGRAKERDDGWRAAREIFIQIEFRVHCKCTGQGSYGCLERKRHQSGFENKNEKKNTNNLIYYWKMSAISDRSMCTILIYEESSTDTKNRTKMFKFFLLQNKEIVIVKSNNHN